MTKYIHYGVTVLLIFAIIALGIFVYHIKEDNSQLRQLQVITEEQATSIKELQKQLDVGQGAARSIQREIIETHSPDQHITISAPSLPEATKIVQERIKNDEIPLPKSDKTIVVPQPSHKYQVGIYNVNLKKNWEVGTGIGMNNGSRYVPLCIQRNYDNCHSIAIQGNIGSHGNITGGQVVWYTGF